MSKSEIKNPLNELVILYDNHDEFKRRLEGLQRAYDSEEWKMVVDCLYTMKGMILTELISHKHTFRPAEEKDVAQKTYFHIIQVLDFLSNPLGWIKTKQSKWERLLGAPQRSDRKEATERRSK